MSDSSEYTTIEEELSKLKEGESLVAIQDAEPTGYYLHIGDNRAGNTWALTYAEMIELRDLLNRKFKV